MASSITGMHYCLPTRILGNAELEQRFGAPAIASIVKMAGVLERRVVEPGITASDLACCAAQRFLAARGIDPRELDLLIFASQTGDYQLPATACVLHARLGLAETCACFDLGLGCSAFPYAIRVASAMVEAGGLRKALVVNAEAITTLIHPLDRGLVPLHGDAAVVSLVEPCPAGSGILWAELGTDGTGFEHLIVPASGARLARSEATRQAVQDEAGCIRSQEHLHMNGPAVFHFSLHKVPEAIQAALAKHGMTLADFDLVLLHQANRTMVDMIYRILKVPEEKRFYFMEKVGNASGASTPMLLAEAWRQGRVKPGGRTLLAAFGVGLSWGILAVQWPAQLAPAPMEEVDYAP
ncbi:MAG: ketoacyl-ACP synthase III [Holophaga sp.]|nr:ketoacyl-ACP synthase III [Holophaga sp.]